MVTYFKDGVTEILGDGVDILFSNEEEATTYTGKDNIEDAVTELKKLAKTLVLTLGDKGAMVITDNERVSIDPVKTTAVEMTRKILVTSALPYANGPIHIGHMVEYIQTDIWARFQRLRGNSCYYVCADDAHGTPIMLRAQQEGIEPQELIDQVNKEHREDFAGFNVQFDNYHTTHSEENRILSEAVYLAARDAGHIDTKVIKQAYDPEAEMFLPDRFIKGDCPNCGTSDQYGDNCEACGATYSTTEVKNAYSVVTGATPIEKDSEHYFFKLGNFTDFLAEWLASGAVQKEVVNKMNEWVEDGLADWDISRDAPYWGFKIPDTEDKYSVFESSTC